MSEIQLRVSNLNLSFRGLHVLHNINIDVKNGELHAVIGPNGAGKSSLLNCISGLYKFQSGEISFQDKPIHRMKTHQIAELGIGRVFQNIELFKNLTVIENLLLGRHRLIKSGVLASAVYLGKSMKQEIEHREKVEEIIEFLEIENYRMHTVGSLPYGLQKRVDLGRALAGEPKLLLLDEPIAGMNIDEKEDMARYINEVRTTLGTTMILIEHDMSFVMDLAEKITVLDFGEKIAEGDPHQIQNDPNVIRAYLGNDSNHNANPEQSEAEINEITG
ncbi:ABC transporter ATP-binding protein [Fredinandcohnia onubensis]|uniref:ABC transporter ATP-binding protein n=1 Tax=Fredinandcohnia onubensis TaxID=1571209 RepID=UPI000C0BC6B6|nr:ABC transporter ATP-binding protein [Fredinandcohnia onubensis]